jgi:hypothetical protein
MLASNFAFPTENIEAYKIIYLIEVSTRELIIEKLRQLDGPRGYKTCLPNGSIQEKFRDGQTYEKRTPWIRCTPHHPIYYLELSELVTIIETKDNWNTSFEATLHNKAAFTSAIRDILPIRNKIAHNRRANLSDLEILNGSVHKLSNIIGEPYLMELGQRSTDAEDIKKSLRLLDDEHNIFHKNIVNLAVSASPLIWAQIKNDWWFDADYLGVDVTPIEKSFSLVSEFVNMDRRRGDGHAVERWIRHNKVEEHYEYAANTLNTLVSTEY